MFYEKFGIEKGSVTGITGSGGKTSLMFLLAEELANKGKVLVTTTTKIYEPLKEQYETLFLSDSNEEIKGNGKNIFIFVSKKVDGKLISPNEEEILKIKSKYDYILYEGDGAKEKLLKFWKEDEPVIFSFTDNIIGILNIKVKNLEFSEENVHRYNMYMNKNNKFFQKKNIDDEILKDCLMNGKFFKNFSGKKMLFLNGVENISEIKTALNFSNDLENFMFGSIKEKKIYVPKKISAIIMGSGKSERFNGNKLLSKIDGVSMIEIILKKLSYIPFKNIFVTYKDKEIFDICKKYNVIPLENKNYFLGQSESIKLGVSKIKDENMMFFTGDMPFLKEETIIKLILEFDNEIVIPMVNNKKFSPVIFPQRYKEDLMKLFGDIGGKEIIKKEKNLKLIEFDNEKEFVDIDTREELKKFKGEI